MWTITTSGSLLVHSDVVEGTGECGMRVQQLAGATLLGGLVVITAYVIDSDGSITADSSSTFRVSVTCPGPTCTIEPVEPTANNCPNGSDCLNIDRPGATSIPETTRSNGVISITVLKDGFPMITNMAINGWEIVPHHHAGADFQFSTRWDDSCCGDGNLYNPTLGGDCEFGPNAPRGNPSCLMGIDQNWSRAVLSHLCRWGDVSDNNRTGNQAMAVLT